MFNTQQFNKRMLQLGQTGIIALWERRNKQLCYRTAILKEISTIYLRWREREREMNKISILGGWIFTTGSSEK